MDKSLTGLGSIYDDSFNDPKYVKHLDGILEYLGDTPLRTVIRLALGSFSRDAVLRFADLGCGTGRDMTIFAKLFSDAGFSSSRLLGCEISPVAVGLCRERGLMVESADMQSFLQRADEPFSILWSHFSIIHLHDDEIGPALSLMASKLTNGGILSIGFKAGDGRRLLDPKDETCRVDRETTYFPHDLITDLFIRNGLEIRASILVPSSGRPVPHQYAWIIGVKV